MFIVTYDDGTIEVQGREVKGWDDIVKGKKIACVTITDGYEIQETLTGFDYYLCCYNGIATLRCSANGTLGTQLPSKVVGQSLFGIRTNGELKRTIKKLASNARLKVDNEFPTEVIEASKSLARARRNDHKVINNTESTLLDWAKSLEVVEVSLEMKKINYSSSELKHNKSSFRDGTGSVMPSIEDELRNKFVLE